MFKFYGSAENSVCRISGLLVTQILNKNVLILQDNLIFEFKDAKDAFVVLRRDKIRLNLYIAYSSMQILTPNNLEVIKKEKGKYFYFKDFSCRTFSINRNE